MADEVKEEVVLTPEQEAAAAAATAETLANGRKADLDAAAAKLAKERAKPDDPDQLAIDAENKAKEVADKAAADKAEADKKAAEADEKNDDGTWKEAYVETGNVHADAAIELMKEAGIKPVEANDIFKDAIAKSDLSLIKWDILESRLGAAKAALVRAGVESYFNGELKEQNATRDAAFEAVGGEANWTKLREWTQAKEKTDKEFHAKAENARKAIQIGGDAAQAAIANLKALYDADPKNSKLTSAKPIPSAGKPAAQATDDIGAPMKQSEYYLAMKASHKAREPDSVRQVLWARRQAGIAKGL